MSPALEVLRKLLPYGLVALASASLVGFVAHAQLTAKRKQHEAAMANLRASQSDARAQAVTDMLGQLGAIRGQLREVAQATTDARKEAHENSQTLQRALGGLRADSAGLRSDIAGLPQHFGGLARSTVEQYASTCTGLLGDLADEGTEMAIEGAGLARAAQGHYIDDRAKAMSWPAPSRAASTHKE